MSRPFAVVATLTNGARYLATRHATVEDARAHRRLFARYADLHRLDAVWRVEVWALRARNLTPRTVPVE